jgi:hypothetical protein
LNLAPKKQLRDHQKDALDAVVDGLDHGPGFL